MNWKKVLDHSELMSVGEVAEYLGTTRGMVRDWAHKGLIPHDKHAGTWLFRRTRINQWLSRRLARLRRRLVPPVFPVDGIVSLDRVLILDGVTKEEALNLLIDALTSAPHVKNRDALAEAIFARERLLSTGVGLGIAIPHATAASVQGVVMSVGSCRQPLLDYVSLDGEPVRLIFMLAAGTSYREYMLTLMTVLAARLKDDELRSRYLDAPDAETLCRLLKQTIPRTGAVR